MGRNYQVKGVKRKYSEERKDEILHSLDTVYKGSLSAAARINDVPLNIL